MPERCMKCSSTKVIPMVGVLDQGQQSDGQLKAHVGYTNPDAWVFKGPVYAPLRATICGACGYVELTAVDAAKAYDAYLKMRDDAERRLSEAPKPI